MTLKTEKQWLLFIPLFLGFIGLAFAIFDLKHPVVMHDQCELIGRGKSLHQFKLTATELYHRSGKDIDDIGFKCQKLGNVLINDDVPMPVEPGHIVKLMSKSFHYFPKRYYIALPVVNPEDAPVPQPSPEENRDNTLAPRPLQPGKGL